MAGAVEVRVPGKRGSGPVVGGKPSCGSVVVRPWCLEGSFVLQELDVGADESCATSGRSYYWPPKASPIPGLPRRSAGHATPCSHAGPTTDTTDVLVLADVDRSEEP